MKLIANTDIENEFWASNKVIAGIDEAGRGPLAGPVTAAVVIFPKGYINKYGINDSKSLSESKRYELVNIIKNEAIDYNVQFGSIVDIEKYNILQATINTMKEAVSNLKIVPDILLIDGNYFPKWEIEHKCIKSGDKISVSIAAASILAKTARDDYMRDIAHEKFSKYGFDKHKGYGTKQHYLALDEFGLSLEHRPSFLKNYLSQKKQYDLF